MVDVKLLSQLSQNFQTVQVEKNFAMNQWQRNNDGWATSKHLSQAISRKNHPVEAVELVVAWSGADVWDIYHDHSYCFVAENDEIDPASKCNFQDGKPKPEKIN